MSSKHWISIGYLNQVIKNKLEIIKKIETYAVADEKEMLKRYHKRSITEIKKAIKILKFQK